ncbi:hypothetical protein Lal_00028269 [Lupinus albus]|nr:hypothetical protein Lal_00028269 [Lupinus albus]
MMSCRGPGPRFIACREQAMRLPDKESCIEATTLKSCLVDTISMQMVINRDIVNNFSDEEDIELCCDDDEDLEIGSSGAVNITYASEDPGIPIKALVKDVVTRFGYTVTYRKALNAKQIAMSQIYGDWEGSYMELPRWLNTVQCYALDTIVRYTSSRHEDSSSLILDKVFWAFKPCIEGFGFCKLILQVDGTFLTGKYTGTLLIASSQDGNRRIFPVAFAIAEGETKES